MKISIIIPVFNEKETVQQILEKVKNRSARAALTTIYCCGLRLSEGTHLKVSDIEFPHAVWQKSWVVYSKPAMQGLDNLLN